MALGMSVQDTGNVLNIHDRVDKVDIFCEVAHCLVDFIDRRKVIAARSCFEVDDETGYW